MGIWSRVTAGQLCHPAGDSRTRAPQGSTSPYLGERQHVQHTRRLHPTGVSGRGTREQVGTGVPTMARPCPTAGHSRGPVSCSTEMQLGKGQHGTGPCDIPELLSAVPLGTLGKGGTAWGHLRSRDSGHRAQPAPGDTPRPGPTSVFLSSSWAAAVEATATATAAEAATLPCLSLGSSFLSAGKCTKSGAVTGWTYSAGKSPDLPWMAPNFHPVPGRWWRWPRAGSHGVTPKILCLLPPASAPPSPFRASGRGFGGDAAAVWCRSRERNSPGATKLVT